LIPDLRKKCICYTLACFMVCAGLSSQPADALDKESMGGGDAPAKQPQAQSGERIIEVEIEALRREMQEKPTDSAASLLGECLLRKGALNEAMAAFNEALKMNPRSFEARIGKGIVLGRQGQFEKAEAMLRGALILNPKPQRVHHELGLLYETKGDFARAIAEYKEGLKNYQEGKK
jgi:cytochrome c-type biogenesis protein CcmH/NrfG